MVPAGVDEAYPQQVRLALFVMSEILISCALGLGIQPGQVNFRKSVRE